MKQFVFSNLIILMKKYSKNPNQAYQVFLTDLFDIIGEKNRYLLSSNASSRIMTRQYDVPKDIRDFVNSKSVEDIGSVLKEFYSKHMNSFCIGQLIVDIGNYINQSINVSQQNKALFKSKTNQLDFLVATFIFAIRADNRLHLKEILWRNGKNKIVLLNGDLMSLSFNAKDKNKEKIVVIPVDVDMHTKVTKLNENPDVSIETLHGMWIKRMEKEGYSADSLNKRYSFNKIGYIVKVYVNSVMFYLVALSKFDQNNTAHSDIDSLKLCIRNILDEYDKTGQGAPIYIPLLGTGRSRINLSYEKSIEIIEEECLKNKEKIQGTVNILVYTSILEELFEADKNGI